MPQPENLSKPMPCWCALPTDMPSCATLASRSAGRALPAGNAVGRPTSASRFAGRALPAGFPVPAGPVGSTHVDPASFAVPTTPPDACGGQCPPYNTLRRCMEPRRTWCTHPRPQPTDHRDFVGRALPAANSARWPTDSGNFVGRALPAANSARWPTDSGNFVGRALPAGSPLPGEPASLPIAAMRREHMQRAAPVPPQTAWLRGTTVRATYSYLGPRRMT